MEVCGFPPLDFTIFEGETPALAIDLDRFTRSARAVAVRHTNAHLQWCPATGVAAVPSVARSLRDSGAIGIAVGSVADAVAAVSAGLRIVTVEMPPVVLGQPCRYAELCRTASLTLVCDHFAQAERIAAACREAGTESQVLLRVDVGLQRLGVRPGPDLSDLAEGVRRLRGVRLTGIWIAGSPSGTGVGRLQGRELSRLFDRCRASLARAGHEMSTLSVVSLEQIGDELNTPTETRNPIPCEQEAVVVLSGVVARPTRNQAVIDAGRRHLGSSARALGPPGATEVLQIDHDFTVLRLSPERQDFAIGDLVALIPETPVKPRSGEPVLVSDNGIWRSEHAC